MAVMSVWRRTAEMLESGQTYPRDDIDAEVRKLIRAKSWAEVGPVLADTYMELNRRATQAQAVTWAAGLLHVLRPMGWEQAPTGEALEQAILEAWRP
jgi:hypothetical protein